MHNTVRSHDTGNKQKKQIHLHFFKNMEQFYEYYTNKNVKNYVHHVIQLRAFVVVAP